MATISETELQRRLRDLENGITGGSNSGVNVPAKRVGADWEYVEPVIYLAYASEIANVSIDGVITNQSDATGFQYTPFGSSGTLLDWRGYLFSTNIYASGDPTDYVWEDVSSISSGVSFTRYTTDSTELRYLIGDPTTPGTGVTWTVLASGSAIPDTAFWVADQYNMEGVDSSWQVYPVKTKSAPTLAVITYDRTGNNMPTLGDSTWNDDVLLAAAAFTGEDYTSVTELGYGSSVVITYDDGKLAGTYKGTGWVTPENFIEGSLLVEDSVTATAIAANTITANEIAADTITASEIVADTITGAEIDATTLNVEDQNLSGTLNVSASSGAISWGKTGPSDLTNTGMYMGNEGGNPYFLVGNSNRMFLFDGENDILYMTGQTVTGPAVVGASTSYIEENGDTRHDVPASVTSVKLELVGGGGGGRGYADAYTYEHYADPEMWFALRGSATNGTSGTSTTIKHYNSNDVLQNSYSASGGTGGDTETSYSGGYSHLSTVYPGTSSNHHGDDYDNGGPADPFTGTGGDGIYILAASSFYGSTIFPTNLPKDAVDVGAGGGGSGSCDYGWDSNHSLYQRTAWLGEGGDDGTYTVVSTVTTNAGDYFIVNVGSGGIGNGTGTGYSASGDNGTRYRSWGSAGDGSSGGARIEILTKS